MRSETQTNFAERQKQARESCKTNYSKKLKAADKRKTVSLYKVWYRHATFIVCMSKMFRWSMPRMMLLTGYFIKLYIPTEKAVEANKDIGRSMS